MIKLFLFLSLSLYSFIFCKVKGLLMVPYRNRHVIVLLTNSKNVLPWGISEHCQRKKVSYLSYTCSSLQVFFFIPIPPTLEKFLPHILLISKGVTVYLWITLLLSKENCTKQEGRHSPQSINLFLVI